MWVYLICCSTVKVKMNIATSLYIKFRILSPMLSCDLLLYCFCCDMYFIFHFSPLLSWLWFLVYLLILPSFWITFCFCEYPVNQVIIWRNLAKRMITEANSLRPVYDNPVNQLAMKPYIGFVLPFTHLERTPPRLQGEAHLLHGIPVSYQCF